MGRSIQTQYERMHLKIANMLFELLYKENDYVTLQKYALMTVQIIHDNVEFTYWLIMLLIKKRKPKFSPQEI